MSHEADDMAGLLTKKLSANPANRIVLLSGDHDWIQLVRPGVTWRDARDATNYVTMDNLFDKTGYKTPLAFLEGKALQGDSSDVIPPVSYRGIGKGTAPQFLAQWGSVMAFFKAVDSGAYVPKTRADPNAQTVHPEQALASLEGRKAFARNLKLMQLLNVAVPAPADVRLVPGKLDRERFRELCDELAFLSITKDFDNFLSAFETN
jgi:5'-3' exonuclease